MRIIKPQQRIAWDVFCFIVIIVSAFEIPYDLLVGWSDPNIERAWDMFFVYVFGFDIILNLLTMRERSYAGFWGWRFFAGFLSKEWSTQANEERHLGERRVLIKQPEVALGYLCSGWFLIDLLATIPWSIVMAEASILNLSRVLRLLRLVRLVRLLRLAKFFRFFDQFAKVTKDYPSMARIIVSFLLLPWFAHIHACLLFYAESSNPASNMHSYKQALHGIFVTFTTNNEVTTITEQGFYVGISAVLFSILFISTVIGNMSALFTKLELKRSPMESDVHTGHTIILGWTRNIFTIINQLVCDDKGAGGDIVILADRNVDEMWQEIAENCVDVHAGEIDVLQGSICSPKNISRVGIQMARQVLVLGYGSSKLEGSAQEELSAANLNKQKANSILDSYVLKATIACCQAWDQERTGRGKGDGYCLPVIATVHSLDVARTIESGLPQSIREHVRLHVVDTSEIIARCLTQIIASPRLSDVFRQLSSYDDEASRNEEEVGCEIYSHVVHQDLIGQNFDECYFGYERALPIGYAKGERVFLNPRPDSEEAQYRLKEGDRLILVARHNKECLNWKANDTRGASFEASPQVKTAKNYLVFGYGEKAEKVVEWLPDYAPNGSTIQVAASFAEKFKSDKCTYEAITEEDSTKRDLETIIKNISSERIDRADSLAIIATHTELPSHDSRILMSLTSLHAKSKRGLHTRPIIIELHDAATYELAKCFGLPVSIISTEMVCNFLVQLAEDRYRGTVFQELLEPEGNELYLRPASKYLARNERKLSFQTIMQRARHLGELAIGYAPEGKRNVMLAPKDREKLLDFTQYGDIVVVAEQL